MKHFFLLIAVLIYFQSLQAQVPVLVKDINPGPIGLFPLSQPSLQIGDVLYFITKVGDKKELYAVRNGEVEYISLICPSGCSVPSEFIFEYKGKLFFKKKIDIDFNELWSTDGTEASNSFVLNYKGSIKRHAIGNNSKLYLIMNNRSTFKDEAYISDGTASGTKKIGTDVYFFSTVLKYGNGIAFTNIINDSLKIFVYDNEQLSVLAKIKLRTNSKSTVLDFKSISKDDLVMLIQSDDYNITEIYNFNSTTKVIKKQLTLPYERFKRPYIKDYNQDSLVLFYHNGGHFILTGDPLSTLNITPYTHEGFGQVGNFCYKYKENLAYYTIDSTNTGFSIDKIILFDGNIENNKEFIVEYQMNDVDVAFAGDHIFYTSTSFNDRQCQFFYINLKDKTNKLLYQFRQDFSYAPFRVLGIVGEKLYFIANLDKQYGSELYYLETGVKTSTEETTRPSLEGFTFDHNGSSYSVQSTNGDNPPMRVNFYDPTGRLIKVQDIVPNLQYPFDANIKGLTFIHVQNQRTDAVGVFSAFIP